MPWQNRLLLLRYPDCSWKLKEFLDYVADENISGDFSACILNLMPLKEDTELQLLRALSNTPLQVDISFMKMDSHQSQNTAVPPEAIKNCDALYTLAESDEAGVFLTMTYDGRQIFIMGHPEYDRVTLANEYKRDLEKGLEKIRPVNYFTNDDPAEMPYLMWQAHCNILYSNWLNYYVYQMTPYELEDDA